MGVEEPGTSGARKVGRYQGWRSKKERRRPRVAGHFVSLREGRHLRTYDFRKDVVHGFECVVDPSVGSRLVMGSSVTDDL